MTTDPPPSTGLIAGKYELVGLIGRGGMGSVWEGVHATLGTRVAIKFIESEYANSKEARDRFDNEARAAARIQSKHAIQIFDHGVTHDGKPYIVMELLSGEPLDKRIERLGRLSLQETARILQQVCRALTRAHENGIIHRDLKPENIFLVKSQDDDDETAKVLDFGIAKMKGPPGSTPGGSGGVSSSTKTGAVLGTPFYMSPEQARGLKNVDHRTDIWSLGVIVFKCVTGVLPFEGESVGDLLVKICTAPVPMPSQVIPGLPAAFDAWFARTLDREPSRRFASAQELADALAYTAGISVRGAPGSANQHAYMPTAPIGADMRGPGATPHPAMPGAYTPQSGVMPQPVPPMAMSASGPSATSAPFTSNARTQSSGKGIAILTSIVVALVSLGGGYFGMTKLRENSVKKDTHVDGAGAPKSSLAANGPATTPPPPVPQTPPATDAADAGLVALVSATPNVPQTKPGHGTRPAPKPPSPPAPATAKTAGGAATTTPLPPPPPPPPATKPGTDPGY